MILLPHQNLDHRFNWSQRNNRIRKFDSLFDRIKPLRQLVDTFLWQVSLDLYDTHRRYFINLFVYLNIGNSLYKIAETYKEALKIFYNLDVPVLLILLLLLELFLILNSFWRQLLLSSFLKVFLVDFLSCLSVISLDTVSSCDQVVSQ